MRALRIAAVVVAASVAGACRDTLAPPVAPTGPDGAHAEAGTTVARFSCTVAGTDLRCEETDGAAAAGGPRRIMLGGGHVKLTSFNVVYDSVADVLAADLTVKNLRTHAIGTANGTSVAFIKAYFYDGPRVTSYKAPGDTGTVTVLNADGTCNCSAANQPYFSYPQILQPNQVSAAKTWRWRMPRSVNAWSFVLYVFTRYPGEADVAALPPDTVPASLYDSAKIVRGDTSDSGWFLRDVVLMGFKPGASAEDRLAAVNWTNGQVVGGMRIGAGGIYFVRVPDDGTGGPLRLALARMKLLPQVAFAGREYVEPEGVSEGASVRPADGSDWEKGDWTLKPDSAGDRGNWGMEAVDAPLAWGCTTGDSAVSIGIVDEDFFDLDDVGETAPGQLGGGLLLHGTRVLSVLAARGDNQQGMAGMIWDFHRQEYNIANAREGKYIPNSGFLRLLWKAIYDDHRVINLSLGARYIDSVSFLKRAPNPASHADSMHARAVGDLTAGVILTALLPGNDPLVVISAGNYGMDAFWGGYARAVNALPNRVVVVGAAKYMDPGLGDGGGRFSRAAWATTPELDPDIGSNWGELVDVYAPGERVGTLTTFGGTDFRQRGNGTSLAAPIVTGIAGLMLSIDPTLTAAELKELIIRGGERGGRVVANGLDPSAQYRYVVNAYESLRAAAERPGAGLCGNMMYRDSTGTTFARRVESGVSSWEAIFQEGAGGISPQHRKRKVWLSNGHAELWRGGDWTLFSTAEPADNATYLSRLGQSHDADTTVTVVKRRVSQFQEEFDVKVNGTLLTTVTGPPVNNPTGISPTRCVAWDTNGTEWDSCYSEARNQPDYRTTAYSVSYSSARREVLLAVVRDSSTWKVELPPFVYAGLWQRNYSYDTYSIDTKLYFIPVGNPSAVRTAVSRGYRLSNVGFSDDGTHLVMRSATWGYTNTYAPDQTHSNTSKTCQAVFSRVFDYNLIHEDRSPDIINGSLLCYPDATYAP